MRYPVDKPINEPNVKTDGCKGDVWFDDAGAGGGGVVAEGLYPIGLFVVCSIIIIVIRK